MSDYKLDEERINFLKQLSESFGPSGFEREVIGIVKDYASRFADETKSDKLGSTAFIVKGSSEKPRVLVAGHVDEVGFIVTSITKEGFLTFKPLGGWFSQVLLSQRVLIRAKDKKILGVIASKPPHLLKEDERNKVITIDQMYIDVGASSKEEVEKMGIRIGDPVVPWSPFYLANNNKIVFGKAFDDRIGAFLAVEALRYIVENKVAHPNTYYATATVQEEVGLRGAQTTSFLVEPDVAIVTEVDIAGDVPGINPAEAPTAIGKGPSIVMFDASMIPNEKLKEFVINVAEEKKIPYQLSVVPAGGTDGGRFHLYKTGCPSVVIGIPTRHIHSHVGILSLNDVENAVKLIVELIRRFDSKTVESFTTI
jgi:endoglucanase